MFGHILRGTLRVAVLVLVLAMAMTVAAQQTEDRVLTPGISVDSSLSANQLAQTFIYNGTLTDIIKLTLISEDGLALGVTVTDSAGNFVGQGGDETGNGFLVIDDIPLGITDTFYINVFALPVPDLPTEGAFSISLAISGGGGGGGAVPLTETATEEAAVVDAGTTATEEAAPAAVVDTGTSGQVVLASGIQISLVWNATADFNLEVRDPLGDTLFWNSPTSESGGTFDGVNVNGACETFTANAPTEAVSFAPGAVPTGSYEILVFYNQDCEANGSVPFTIDAVVDGTAVPQITGTMLPNQVFAASFEVDVTGIVTPRTGGIVQESLPAPSADIIAAAQPITQDAPTTGAITNDQVFQSYSFDAAIGDVVSASVEATSGSLDTFLFLLDNTGAVVAQNDDANDTTRNSQIANQAISSEGTYTLVATRYAQNVGGTEGEFALTLTGATAETAVGVDTALLSSSDLPDGLPQGIIEIVLNWNTTADLQLLVRDPAGEAVFDTNPTISSGGQLLLTGNVDCSNAGPLSYINWPTGTRIRPGTYEIDVWFQNNCDDQTPVNATLNVGVRNGGTRTNIITEEFTPLLDEHFIITFTINADGTITTGPGGIAGGSETIDYTGELGTAPALTANIPVQGNISDDNRFDVYTFDGVANTTVSVRMDATAGTLDPLIFLLGPTGIELASNDDIVPGENRNSLISEFTLPQSGQYIVLATHYGTIFGGTNGVYTLVLSQ